MKRRPELKFGTICRPSKRSKYPTYEKRTVFIVIDPPVDDNGHSKVGVIYINKAFKMCGTRRIKRKHLWSTGKTGKVPASYKRAVPNQYWHLLEDASPIWVSQQKSQPNQPKTNKKSCTCTISVLMSRGCACGGT